MGVLSDENIQWVHHYSPLHYLPFIARSKSLRNKPSLRVDKFPAEHFRSMSKRQDEARGFGGYTHLTLEPHPPILKAKLGAGFPHVGIAVPAPAIDDAGFDLCRFNVAMTRYLKRDGNPGFPESPTNGRYYGGLQIPVAKDDADKKAMLKAHLNNNMIEVLIDGDLSLPDDTTIQVFSKEDAVIAKKIISEVGVNWPITQVDAPAKYPRSSQYAKSVEQFVDQALADVDWRGNGLEFDRV